MIGRTISHYRILRRLDEGGMGVVYVAEDLTLGRLVAVKLPVSTSEEKDYRARFLREARAVSALSHPHIAAVYDYGELPEPDGQPFIVMELVNGRTLGELLQESALTLSRAVEIVIDVAEALGEAHRHQIVHRDVKPSNVMVNERGKVKVLDFGLAKQLSAGPPRDGQTAPLDLTRSDVIVGTPMYLSPEQARGAPVDGRSDLFSLGALLYECAAGRPPFSGANAIEIGGEVIHVNPPPPSRFNPRVTPELDRATMKALAKKPEARYQTAEEMASDLRAALGRLSRSDTERTRRLAPPSAGRSSVLRTLTDGMRRPTISPVAFFGTILLMLLGVWGYGRLSGPSRYVPKDEAKRLYDAGADFMREGSYDQASRVLQRAVEIDQKYALARAALAEAWTELDYLERANAELVAVGALVRDGSALSDLEALYLDAIQFTALRRTGDAAEAYQKIAKQRPDEPQVYVDLGRAYEKNEEPKRAIESYHQALKLHPAYAAAHLRLGIIYGRQQEILSALNYFKKAEELYGDNKEGRAEVLYQRGFLRRNNGKPAEAREDMEQALMLAREAQNFYQLVRAQLALSDILAIDPESRGEAERLAREAVELSLSKGMDRLPARAYVDLGNVHLANRELDESEKYYRRALELATGAKDKRNEARALVQLGSLYQQRTRPDEALGFVAPALEYYRANNFRKEVLQCYAVIARAQRQKGDYDSALKVSRDQLREATEVNFKQHMAYAYSDIGRVLVFQERYPEALENFGESYSIHKSLDAGRSMRIAAVNRAEVLVRLGHHDEARALMEETVGSGGSDPSVASYFVSVKAEMALAGRQFAEARAVAAEAVEAAAGRPTETSIIARRVLCLAHGLSGAAREAVGRCEEAVGAAEQSGDPALRAQAVLALAEVLLEAGDAAAALDRAADAESFFARHQQTASRWRALLVSARAAARLGRQDDARAGGAQARDLLLTDLAERFGQHHRAYLARPDVQVRLRQLDELLAVG